VTLFKAGDEVYGFKHGRVAKTYRGTYAEYAVVPENTLAHKPAKLSHEEAAAIPLAALTAWQAMVNLGKLKAGHKVLVHAGAGGVGVMAIQIAKALGAFVAATASTANQGLLSELGADLPIDYTREKIEDTLSGFDLVLDGVGKSVWPSSFKVLRRGGRLVTLTLPVPDPPAGKIKFYGTIISSVISSWLGGMFRRKWIWVVQVKPRGGELEKITELVDAGKLHPVIAKVYPLEQIAEAHRESEQGHVRGKLVLSVIPKRSEGTLSER
jgi:NADPH:quinone reductase-like Zn-dependent oxidoreductase